MKVDPVDTIVKLTDYRQPSGVITGRIVSSNQGNLLVDYSGNPSGPVKARITSSVKKQLENHTDLKNAEVLLAVDADNGSSPIIIDTLFSYIDEVADQASVELSDTPETIKVDGKKVLIEGKDEIVLRCGESKIIMKENKIVIHSKNIKTHATKNNKIKGGLIKIN